MVAQYQIQRRSRSPDKYKANTAVSNAVRDSSLNRPDKCITDLRRQLRDNKLKFNSLALNNNTITMQFANNADRDAVMDFLRRNGNEFTQQAIASETGSTLRLSYTDV